MNRKFFKILMAGAVAGLLASCSNEDIAPDTPDVPTEGYHLTFDGGVGIETGTRAVWSDDNGSGNLIFQWDYFQEYIQAGAGIRICVELHRYSF